MSEGERIPYLRGMAMANTVMDLLEKHCERIEVAGSLRRKKETVGDIELVLIPKSGIDLFGHQVSFGDETIEWILKGRGYEFTKKGMYFKQVIIPDWDFKCDLFLTSRLKWGVIFTIRTGSADFSHKLVTQKYLGGMCPNDLHFWEGRIWRGSLPLDTPEEQDVFNALGLAWIAPEDRI